MTLAETPMGIRFGGPRDGHDLLAVGWPCLALSANVPSDQITNMFTDDAALLWLAESGLLPLRVSAVGFALDTALYTLFWYGLLLIPAGAPRRFIRRKRGCCVACGYDLSGAAHEKCPECGAQID